MENQIMNSASNLQTMPPFSGYVTQNLHNQYPVRTPQFSTNSVPFVNPALVGNSSHLYQQSSDFAVDSLYSSQGYTTQFSQQPHPQAVPPAPLPVPPPQPLPVPPPQQFSVPSQSNSSLTTTFGAQNKNKDKSNVHSKKTSVGSNRKIVRFSHGTGNVESNVEKSSTATTTSTIRNFLGVKNECGANKSHSNVSMRSDTRRLSTSKSDSQMSCSANEGTLPKNDRKKVVAKRTQAKKDVDVKLGKRKTETQDIQSSKRPKILDSDNKVGHFVSSTAGSAGSDSDTRKVVHRRFSEELDDGPDRLALQDPEKIASIQSWIDQWEPNDPHSDSMSDFLGDPGSSSTNRTSPDSVATLSVSCCGDDNRKIVMTTLPKACDSGISSIGEHAGTGHQHQWRGKIE